MPMHLNPRANVLQKALVKTIPGRGEKDWLPEHTFIITYVDEPWLSYDLHHIVHAASVYAAWMCSSNEEKNKMQDEVTVRVRNTVCNRTGFACVLLKTVFQSWTVLDCASLGKFKLHCFCPDRLAMSLALFRNQWQNPASFSPVHAVSFPVFTKCFHLAKKLCVCLVLLLSCKFLTAWNTLIEMFGALVSMLLKKRL